MTYLEAQAKFARARCKERGARLRGRMGSTRLVRCGDGAFGILVHDTIVVKIHGNGTYTLNSGSWRTKLTKERIQEYAPVSLCSSSGGWFLSATGKGYYWGSGDRVLFAKFVDGIRVNSEGRVLSGAETKTAGELRAEEREARNERARERRAYKKAEFARRNPEKVCAVGKQLWAGAL